MTTLQPDTIHEAVRQRYGRIATEFTPAIKATDGSCCDDGSGACCSSDSLYEFDLNDLPADVSQLSLGCGDPITLAGLSPGQTVLDLGSGGGIDCFLAVRQVGQGGYVIGVDMTPAMLEKAERNKATMGYDNVDFRFGQIERLPVDDNAVDVVISNCVINLSPDKPAVFREAYRVLKPGGRIAVSDMVTQGHFSPEERADMAQWSGCITGAEDVADYVEAIKAAGFSAISVQDKEAPDVELSHSLGLYIGQPRLFSARVTAVKPS
jgi:SAM-dependent methyltransferase